MTVDVLIPFGGADPVDADEHRLAALGYITTHYRQHHPDWAVRIGVVTTPWSKGAALASALAGSTADMLILADADSFVDPTVLVAAAASAFDEGWAMPHATVHRLSQAATADVYAGAPPNLGHLDRPAYRGVKGGGIVAIRRDAWDTVGGIDPRFEGWGGEDLAFGHALNALVGAGARLPGDLVHLWHPHPAPDLRGSPASEALLARYRGARADPDAMRRLIDERGGER